MDRPAWRRVIVAVDGKAIEMGERGGGTKLPIFEESLAALLFRTKDCVIAPMRARLREYDITEPQWRVLRVIADRGETDATVLSEVGLLYSASVTRILKDLEDRELIVRQPDPNDGRRTTVALSPAGRDIYKALSRHVLRITSEFSRRFGGDRLTRLTNELKALCATIDDVG